MGTGRIIGWNFRHVSPNGCFAPRARDAAHAPNVARAALGFASAFVSLAVAAAPVKTAHVEAELVAAKTAIVPGEPHHGRAAPRDGRRVGTRTGKIPGDSGLPTTLAWKLPAGIEAGPIEWPAPQVLPVGPLVNYGYEGEVLHLVELKPQRTLADGGPRDARGTRRVARLQGSVHTRRRRPDAHVAGGGDAPTRTRAGAAPMAAARAALPQPLAGWRATASGSGATVELTLVPPPGAGDPGTIRVLPVRIRTGSIPRDRSP